MKKSRGVYRLRDVVGRPVDKALTERCLIGKEGHDACYVLSPSSPSTAALRDDGHLRWTFRSERDLNIVKLSSVQMEIKKSSTRYMSSVPFLMP
jgi:hypothetical protein